MTATEHSPTPDVGDAAVADHAALPDHIVFYDGVCGFCNESVRFLMKLDTEQRLRYAPLQGDTAAALGIEWDDDAPAAEATFKFVDLSGPEPIVHERMTAVAAELAVIDRWPVLRGLIRVTPRVVTDAVYRVIAANRYRIFGKYDECRIPSERERSLFLP